MDAIQMLKAQHREVDSLFEAIEKATKAADKEAIFNELADALAIHATIEEMHFYPMVAVHRTEDILLESLEEHLGIKRVIADLLKTEPSDPTYDAKIAVLKERVQHHVKEEQNDLFPKVSKIFDKEQLEAIGQAMQATASQLEGTAPRFRVPSETISAPTLQ